MKRISPYPSIRQWQWRDKSIISNKLKFVFALLIVFFSLDFGLFKFSSLKTRTIIIKCLCIFQTLVSASYACTYTFVFFTMYNIHHSSWLWICTFQHCITVFFLIFNNKLSFADFYNDLLLIDKKLGIDASSKQEYFFIALTSSCLLYRIFLHFVYCSSAEYLEFCNVPITVIVLVGFYTVLSNELFLTVYSTIYYFLYYRLKVFTHLVCSSKYDVVTSHYLYKSIADLMDSIQPVYNNLYAVFLFFDTIAMMMTTFRPLLSTDSASKDIPLNVATAMSVLLIFVTLFSPAFAAGLLSSQVDQLKIILQNRLIEERDQYYTINIERFAHYIEVRPLRVIIWNVIPLDWQLPVITVKLIVTYLIVVLQFSHRY